MGCYAEIVRASFPGAVAEPDFPRGTGWVVLTASCPSPAEIRRLFPSACRLLLITGADEQHPTVDDVDTVRFVPGPPPALTARARKALARGYGAAVLLDGIDGTSGRLLNELKGSGVSHVAWRRGVGWYVTPIARAIMRKPVAQLERMFDRSRLGRWYRKKRVRAMAHSKLCERNSQAWFGQREWLSHIERVGLWSCKPRGDKLSVMLYIGQLNSGGAERQLVNLALGLSRLGHKVTVFTTYPLSDENAHYCEDLARGGVAFAAAGSERKPGVRDALRELDVSPEIVGALPEIIRDPVLDLAGELLAHRPDVLHCWLDYPNIIGAAAAAVAGMPHAIMSSRNLNPTWFPAFYQSWMDVWYERLVNLPQMHLAANSSQGADDYARWMGVPRERFEVIYNGVDLARMTVPDPKTVTAFRREIKLAAEAPLLVGVFRLAQEKQPDLFLDTVEHVFRRRPDLRVALVGIGDMKDDIVESVERRGLDGVVTLLGQRKDVPVILAAADVMLLTSKVEGTPNVVLEAQWSSCPPVATNGGGTADAMVHEVTGFVHECDDDEGLGERVVKLLDDELLRVEMSRAGRRFVAERFGLDHMVDTTLHYYESILGPSLPTSKVSARTSTAAVADAVVDREEAVLT
ncbi:MAG: glycosyltransferase involved in cell wall biosynthesis [Pseudohongiellaceae bacterium]|jgi:glycosyltransferase involved in cell wall biosynthesis